jgi:hypothetical protein
MAEAGNGGGACAGLSHLSCELSLELLYEDSRTGGGRGGAGGKQSDGSDGNSMRWRVSDVSCGMPWKVP